MQASFILGVDLRNSLIFGKIWIGDGDLCDYVNFGAGLYQYGDESHSRN